MRTRSTLPDSTVHDARRRRALTAVALAIALTITMVPGGAVTADEPTIVHLSGLELTSAAEFAQHYTTNTDRSRTSALFSITGTLTDLDAQPLANHPIRVSLDPGPEMMRAADEEGVGAVILPLAETNTNAAGRFHLTVPALRDISSYTHEDGQVSLLFTGASDTHSVMWNLYATLPTAPGEPALSGLVDERNFSDAAVTVSREGGDVVLTGITLQAFPMSAEPSPQGHLVCGPGGHYRWVAIGSNYHRWKKLRLAETGSRVRLETSYQTTHNTTMTKAVQAGTGWLKGAFSKSNSNTTSLGIHQNFGNNTRQWYDLSWRWRNYEYQCRWPTTSSTWQYAGHREARPMEATLSTRLTNWFSTRPCGGGSTDNSWRPSIPPSGSRSVFTSASHTTTLGATATIQGVIIDVRHTGTTTNGHKSHWFNTSSVSTRICGIDDYAARTLNVRGEIW